VKIEMTKTYRTRKGYPYRLLCIDAPGLYPVVGLANGLLVRHTLSGVYNTTVSFNDLDLVEVSPYADFKLDEPVMARFDKAAKFLRYHFAKFSEEGPYVFTCGGTSWSSRGVTSLAFECRRPTPEELSNAG